MTEKELFNFWVDHNCGRAPEYELCDSEWAKAKSDYLAGLFGIDNFDAQFINDSFDHGVDEKSPYIIKFPVQYYESRQTIEQNFYNIVTKDGRDIFYNKIKDIMRQYYYDFYIRSVSNIAPCWLNNSVLVRGKTEKITTPSGKVVSISETEKLTHALKKLLRETPEWDDEFAKKYDNFLTSLSQIWNQKELTGTMCISIHPMDYITMSDNNCGWSSCMSWSSRGSYRMGTVEMLNSPCVVVAYLESEKPYYMDVDRNGVRYRWNNKKWRQLFIVDHNIISEIKSYPYRNESLSKMVMAHLVEMAAQYWPESKWTDVGYITPYSDKEDVYFCPTTNDNGMYNDISNNNMDVLFSYNTNTDNSEITNHRVYEILYSGIKTCMICGEEIDDDDADSQDLVCEDCGAEHLYCYCCGTRVTSDDVIWYGDEPYCEDCFSNNFGYDELIDDYAPVDDIYNFNIVGLSDEIVESFYSTVDSVRDYLGTDPIWSAQGYEYIIYAYESVPTRYAPSWVKSAVEKGQC